MGIYGEIRLVESEEKDNPGSLRAYPLDVGEPLPRFLYTHPLDEPKRILPTCMLPNSSQGVLYPGGFLIGESCCVE